MCCRPSTRPITAASPPSSIRRIAACRWPCGSAGRGRIPPRVGALLLRGRDGAMTPLSAVAKITTALSRSLVDHQDGLRRQIVVASPRVSDQVGFARGGAQGDRGQGAAAAGRVSALRRRRRGAGGGRARAHPALGGRGRADRAAAGAGVRACPPRAARAAGAAEHADRRRGRGRASPAARSPWAPWWVSSPCSAWRRATRFC